MRNRSIMSLSVPPHFFQCMISISIATETAGLGYCAVTLPSSRSAIQIKPVKYTTMYIGEYIYTWE